MLVHRMGTIKLLHGCLTGRKMPEAPVECMAEVHYSIMHNQYHLLLADLQAIWVACCAVPVLSAGLTGDRAALVAAILQKHRSSGAGASGTSSPADSPRAASSRSLHLQQQQQGYGDSAEEVRGSGGGAGGGLTRESSSRSLQSSLSRSSLVNAVLQRQRDKAAAALGASGGGAGSAGGAAQQEGLGCELSNTMGSARSTGSAGGASDRAAIVAAVLQQQRMERQGGGDGPSRGPSIAQSPRAEASGESVAIDRSSLVAAVLQRHRGSSTNLNSTAPANMGGSNGGGSGRESRGGRRPSTGTLEPGAFIGESLPTESLSTTAARSSSVVRGAVVANLVARHQQSAQGGTSNRSSLKAPFPAGANTGRLLSPRAPNLEGVKVAASLPTALQRPLPLGASLVEKLTRASIAKK